MSTFAEYIWIDGTPRTKQLRSKTRVIPRNELPPAKVGEPVTVSLDVFPEWGADGSSTHQAEGRDSDIVLRPVRAYPDPFRPGDYMVMCEVFDGSGRVHPTNTRAELRRVLDAGAAAHEPMFGFEQEYTLFTRENRPLGFPGRGYPPPQGPYYCAVGSNNIAGRKVYEDFLQACRRAALPITGVNWEVMPGQAEVQVAAVGLEATDALWLARYLLHRAAEEHDVVVSLDAKPVKGDWNGAGMHTNFSTKAMREPGGLEVIKAACEAIGRHREEHLAVYGDGYQDRLTGHHETCSYEEFRYGIADRTASIRIPRHVGERGHGYLEDRRPNANADPYEVASRLLRTVLGID
jgi:glutamine synthetase